MQLTDAEATRREALRLSKPLVHAKVMRYPALLAQGRSIAQVQLEYSFACNMRCAHCAITTLRDDRPTLTPDDVRMIAEQADALGLAQFTLTGGEPLIFPDLEDVLAALTPERFYIALDTNGYFLADKAAWLKAHGVDKVQVSLDNAYPWRHNRFRGKDGSWERAVEGIGAAKEAGLQVIIATVVTDERLRDPEFDLFLALTRGWGVSVFANLAKPVGEWADREVMATPFALERIAELRAEGHDIFHHTTPSYGLDIGCIAVKRQFAITAHGDVLPCPWIQKVLGNVLAEPLGDILTRAMDAGYRERIEGCPGAFGEETP
jgi:MoaA/NifB/PqqE/SkfB family radical SAM enzyme